MTTKTTSIKVTSRESIKCGENYFTVEYTEERAICLDGSEINADEAELAQARKELWDTCNAEVDNQIEEIVKLYGQNRRNR